MDRTVFTNANLVDGEHPAKPGSPVIIKGNRITSVGTGTVTDLAAGDRVVDLEAEGLDRGPERSRQREGGVQRHSRQGERPRRAREGRHD